MIQKPGIAVKSSQVHQEVVVPNLWCCENTAPQDLQQCVFQHRPFQDGSKGWPVDMAGWELPVKGGPLTRNGQESLPAPSRCSRKLKFPKNRHRPDPGGLLGREIRMFLGLIEEI